jgi:hypothetical protein
VKLIEDCLTKLGFWQDDSQVADLHVSKAWGAAVGIYVAIRAVPPVPPRVAAAGETQNPEFFHG